MSKTKRGELKELIAVRSELSKKRTKTKVTGEELEVLEYWNSKKIIVHKPDLIGLHFTINRAINEYGKKEIFDAIDRYYEVYSSEYWFNYKWNLKDFLRKRNAMPDFFPEGVKWLNYIDWKEKQDKQESKPEPKQEPVFSIESDFYRQYLDWMKSMPYEDYLLTEHWQHFRKEALIHAGHRCQLCGTKDVLHVHHKHYANRGRETFNDVIVLCNPCHTMVHEHKCKSECVRCDGETKEHTM